MSFLSRQTWTNSFLYQISLTSSSLSLALLRKCFWRPRFFQLPPKATNDKQNAESVVSLCNVFQLSVVIDSPDNHPRASFAPRSTKLSYSAAKLSECASSSCWNHKNTKSVCDVYFNLKNMQKQKPCHKSRKKHILTITQYQPIHPAVAKLDELDTGLKCKTCYSKYCQHSSVSNVLLYPVTFKICCN